MCVTSATPGPSYQHSHVTACVLRAVGRAQTLGCFRRWAHRRGSQLIGYPSICGPMSDVWLSGPMTGHPRHTNQIITKDVLPQLAQRASGRACSYCMMHRAFREPQGGRERCLARRALWGCLVACQQQAWLQPRERGALGRGWMWRAGASPTDADRCRRLPPPARQVVETTSPWRGACGSWQWCC